MVLRLTILILLDKRHWRVFYIKRMFESHHSASLEISMRHVLDLDILIDIRVPVDEARTRRMTSADARKADRTNPKRESRLARWTAQSCPLRPSRPSPYRRTSASWTRNAPPCSPRI